MQLVKKKIWSEGTRGSFLFLFPPLELPLILVWGKVPSYYAIHYIVCQNAVSHNQIASHIVLN